MKAKFTIEKGKEAFKEGYEYLIATFIPIEEE